jgi:hypothetical protein
MTPIEHIIDELDMAQARLNMLKAGTSGTDEEAAQWETAYMLVRQALDVLRGPDADDPHIGNISK